MTLVVFLVLRNLDSILNEFLSLFRSTIRDKIIPHAVSWFTGEAIQGEDFGDLEDDDDEDVDIEEDDDEEEDEDEDDDDDEDEKETKTKKKVLC